jgi:hypothetical protein
MAPNDVELVIIGSMKRKISQIKRIGLAQMREKWKKYSSVFWILAGVWTDCSLELCSRPQAIIIGPGGGGINGWILGGEIPVKKEGIFRHPSKPVLRPMEISKLENAETNGNIKIRKRRRFQNFNNSNPRLSKNAPRQRVELLKILESNPRLSKNAPRQRVELLKILESPKYI